MANVFVRSGAGGAATGVDWANAYLTLPAALAAKAAGDKFFVSEDHAEASGSDQTFASPGTHSNPCEIYCVSHTGSVPPVSADLRTTATIQRTSGPANQNFNGYVSHCYGITFSCGVSYNGNALTQLGNGSAFGWVFESCVLECATTGGNNNQGFLLGNFTPGYTDNILVLKNTPLKFNGGSDQHVYSRGSSSTFRWYDTPNAVQFVGAPPSPLFQGNSSWGGAMPSVVIEGVDLSGLSGAYLAAVDGEWQVSLRNCRIPSSLPLQVQTQNTWVVDYINCDSGATNTRTERRTSKGTQTTETTIVRTGGATDGTTPHAIKIDTNANAIPGFPFECLPIIVWNDNSGSAKTLTIYGVWGGGAVPNNNDIWIEVEYPSSASYPISSHISSGLADGLASAAANASDSSTWGGSTTKFKMSVTFTPLMKGPLKVSVRAGLASSTFYVDPKPVIT